MRRADRVTHLLHDLEHRPRVERALSRDVGRERLTTQELHREPRNAHRVIHAGGDDLDDVLAVDLRSDARFLLESRAEARVGDELREHELERALLAGADLLRDVHGAHPAFAEELEDFVITGKHRPR